MKEAEVKFENEGRDGVVPVGTYLVDAAKRLGIRPEAACVPDELSHYCELNITSGSEFLSERTSAENEYFKGTATGRDARLGCQARIDAPGEVVIMTRSKKESEAKDEPAEVKDEDYIKKFADMPLEKKIANLVRMEAIALGDTFSYIVNSPYLVFDKVLGVAAEFGFKIHEEEKKAARPKEHAETAKAKQTRRRGPKPAAKRSAGSKEKPAE
jgi:ferredoxin